MGRQVRDQGQLFYEFSLDEMIPTDDLLRRINVFTTAVLADLHYQPKRFYSDIGRPVKTSDAQEAYDALMAKAEEMRRWVRMNFTPPA